MPLIRKGQLWIDLRPLVFNADANIKLVTEWRMSRIWKGRVDVMCLDSRMKRHEWLAAEFLEATHSLMEDPDA